MNRQSVWFARRGWTLALGFIVAGAGSWWGADWRSNNLANAARKAFAGRRHGEALELARGALFWRPGSSRALVIAGDCERMQGNYANALAWYDKLPLGSSTETIAAQVSAAQILIEHLGQPSAAEERFRRVLEVDPQHPVAIEGLADLLGLTARRWEAIPLVLQLLRQGHYRIEHLTLLGAEGGAHPSAELWQLWIRGQPEDPLANLALAWEARNAGDLKETERRLRLAVARRPNLVEAQAQLGELILACGRVGELADWERGLPSEADDFPQVWTVRAEWARRCGNEAGAIRCYVEALRRNPNLPNANYQLAQVLQARGDALRAAPFLKQSAALQELWLRESVLLNSEHTSVEPLRRVAEQLESLGRLWEAWGWSRYARELDPSAAWPRAAVTRLESSLVDVPAWTRLESNPAAGFAIAEFPLPDWPTLKCPQVSPGPADTPSRIQFTEVAADVGLDFCYFNSGDASTPGQFMYEFTGGGVAVLDYDGDSWPDLYFTQGCPWPARSGKFEFVDQLFRNRSSRFENVTGAAVVRENAYSQGVAAGDLDGDGFTDLYVGNIGRNRLFMNNGDGTFREEVLAADPGRWTTSCVIADFNGDAWPDLYAVNYVEGPDVFERICQHADGVPRMCGPFDFRGAPDEFYLNQGDGQFVADAGAGFTAPGGKGLGVAVADFAGRGRLDLFVANDLDENFYFVNQMPRRGGPPRFTEQALPLGLAYSSEGRAQGCMGIAVGDATEDGQLDLLVTNFLQEPNAFYVQQAEGQFSDAVAGAGLRESSLMQLGFGTQFLDGDLDGHLDLVVTNGHVDDHRAYGRAYHMPPQFFRNTGRGRFQELPATSLGKFFSGAYLGRGLARLDWNRDGAEDAVISHLDSPAALLTNTTPTRGNFIALHLKGVQSERDAIGTILTWTVGEKKLVRQVTAGDGYQASNERVVIFGLGSDTSHGELSVRWPSGISQRFTNVPQNQNLVLVEGRAQWYVLP
ncbi:MAG: putative system TPR-repeat lipoprotein [Planctomycetaceae bacterium]|nr:putative system TPR-repeat lipoprotein [Planctomycetaceae bacterium]